MEGIKLNDKIEHIFNEAILDFQNATVRGDKVAREHFKKFNKFIADGEVPVSELGYLYDFYKTQQADPMLNDPALKDLKEEVGYMWNLLNENYTVTDNDGILVFEDK